MTDRTVEQAGTGGASSASAQGSDRSLGEIVSSITTDLSALVKQEIELAKTELKDEVGKLGKGVGMLAGAGVAGHFVLIFLSLTGMFALDLVLPLWLSALIVTLVWGIIAAVLALLGRKEIQSANPQLPQTQQTLKEDAQWAKAQRN